MYIVWIIIGCLMLLLALFILVMLIYTFVTKKNREIYNTKNTKKEETMPQKVKKYCEETDELLKKFKKDDNYSLLKEALEKLPPAYNLYVSELLGTKKISKKSLNPAVATALGNTIGGFPCGVAMGLSAIEKKEYRKNQLKEFEKKYSSINDKEKKVIYLINTIENIINQQ